MIRFSRGIQVDRRYALKEELDEVKDDVKHIKEDTVELKTISNFIKWLIVISIPLIPVITSVVEEIKDSAIQDPVDSYIKQKGTNPQIVNLQGKTYLLLPNGQLKEIP